MARTILVDGYNVIRRDPTLAQFERTSLEHARDVLVSCLNASPAFRQDEIICVFDGAGSAATGVRAPRSFRRGRVRVVFSPPGESADTVIRRFATNLAAATVVVTNDNEVRAAVQAAGARVASLAPRATPARPTRPRPPHTNDTWVKADDLADAPPPTKKGNPRRAPRRRKRDEDLRW
jgi:predicted RNA-binding protein with PIN domain